ncbi:MAG TPA: hypothetical protein VNO30_45525 [Kofleriaceae bacterium]|nr:hypothetical protein [Kofleriaceae bacterium]
MRTQAHALSTVSLTTLTTLTALFAFAGTACVGEVGGSDAGRTRKPKTTDGQDGGDCQKLEAPVTIRGAADLEKLPTGCWDLYAKLRIEGAAVTSIARLGKLTAVNDLEIVDTGLTTLDVPAAFDVWGAITITGNTKLTTLDKIRLQDADDLDTSYTIRGNAALTSLAGVAFAKNIEGELRIADNAKLSAITFDELTAAGSVAITGNGATSLDLGSLQQVGRVEISNNAQLASLTGAAAPAIKGDLVLRGNRALASLGAWSGVTRIEGSLTIDDNDALTSLGGFAGMQYVTSSVSITNNALLANIDTISHLAGIGQTVLVTGNTSLSNCRAMELDYCVASGTVSVYGNQPNTGGSCPRFWCE